MGERAEKCSSHAELVTVKITVSAWWIGSPWPFSQLFQFFLSFTFDISVVNKVIRAMPDKDRCKIMEVNVRSNVGPVGTLKFAFLCPLERRAFAALSVCHKTSKSSGQVDSFCFVSWNKVLQIVWIQS